MDCREYQRKCRFYADEFSEGRIQWFAKRRLKKIYELDSLLRLRIELLRSKDSLDSDSQMSNITFIRRLDDK